MAEPHFEIVEPCDPPCKRRHPYCVAAEAAPRLALEWQCTCGAWVPVGYGRHSHYAAKPVKFEDLIAMRVASEAGLEGVVPDVLDAGEITNVYRTKEMPTR